MEFKRTLNNLVLIRLDAENDSIKLRNGIELYVDNYFEPEKNATVTGVVCGLPSHLSYTGKGNQGMPWFCDMEARCGEKVILYYLSVINALKKENQRYVLEGKDRYILTEYQNIYCVYGDGFIRPINGYVLIESCEDPAITRDKERMKAIGMEPIISGKKSLSNVSYGIVRYTGKPNKEYTDEFHSDEGVDVVVGDVVVIRKTHDIPLQYELYSKIESGKNLLRVQRRHILAKA